MIGNNLFNRPGQGQGRGQASPQLNNSEDEGKGYGCAVYEDHLILLGTTREIRQSRGGSLICAYNLKEQRAAEITQENLHMPIGSCTPALYHRLPGGIVFYGKVEVEAGRGMGMGRRVDECANVVMKIQKLEGGNFPYS